jgi:hypothetical protein
MKLLSKNYHDRIEAIFAECAKGVYILDSVHIGIC